MQSPLRRPAQDERGFILVGVVTFMLALTILGMSLFALSSYEAQFFTASAAREQSLQNSESGMELVKALLAAPGRDLSRLEYAHRAEGQMGVTSAMAYQWRSADASDTTSSGPVDWNNPLVIVVAAKSGGVERTLQAKYMPGVAENPYQRLLAAGTGVSVTSTDPTVLRLSGRAWQPVASAADTSWTDDVDWTQGRPVEGSTPPVPMGDAFVDDHVKQGLRDPSAGTSLSSDQNYELVFQGPPGPTFYHSPPSPTDNNHDQDQEFPRYSFYVGDDLRIKVQGIAVWVVDQGVCFDNQVFVNAYDPGVPSTLVIVAKANLRDPGRENRGIWFRGGLKIYDGVQVYLVSEGDVSVVHVHDRNETHAASTLSIVAGGRIEIGGPQSGELASLGYDPSSMDALADQLISVGALPEVTGGTGANFVAIRPSWLEISPR